MASNSLIGLVVIATVLLVVNANTLAEKSLGVTTLLDPLTHEMVENQHKLFIHGTDGKQRCLMCQPSHDCGCFDIESVRCENKRLTKKLHRLRALIDTPEIPHPEEHDE